MHDYLADPCPEPALSSDIVYALTYETPMHARHRSPRLGGERGEPSARGDIGSAIHSLCLGGAEVVYADLEFENWAKKAAQEFRRDAREEGKIALLACERMAVETAAHNVRALIANQFGAGTSEVTMAFQLGGCWARGRADFLPTDVAYDVDLKTVDSAAQGEWVRKTVRSGGLDIQAGLRSLGHKALGKPREMLWILQEYKAPYATSIVGMDPSMIALAERKCIAAAATWRKCLDSKVFPGYSSAIHWAPAAAYDEADFEQREQMKGDQQ